ncbi:MAG: hypothetical protein RJA70_4056 [Pseudomonadota bacterium]|jgi:uncharacterized membrane protein YebE (DUF533 family)
MAEKLGRDVFMALASVGWADGKLDQEEADAIVRLASDEGLELEEIAAIDEATKNPVSAQQVALTKLSRQDRLFVYAVAAWMTRLDGQISESEVARLGQLGDWLQLDEKSRVVVDGISRDVGQLPAGAKPLRYDLGQVRRLIQERLATLGG